MTYREFYEINVKKLNSKYKLISKLSLGLVFISGLFCAYSGAVQAMANYGYGEVGRGLIWFVYISISLFIISLILLITSISIIHSNFRCTNCGKNISKAIKIELRVQKIILKTEASFIPTALTNCPCCKVEFDSEIIDK